MRGKPLASGCQVKLVDFTSLFEHRSRLDEHLARHMENCRLKSIGQKFLSLCSDKASVGGFNLQASLIVLTDGTALIPPPQAGWNGAWRVGQNRQIRPRESRHVTSCLASRRGFDIT